ncbi:MAG: hypothetical protein KatS3mg083_313 [Candidatus Dojkabacteria bacterium]|nr:MAG: hypothetical protein KatS3mg083_313 [Candidatus Dojkabacteria bacterium]
MFSQAIEHLEIYGIGQQEVCCDYISIEDPSPDDELDKLHKLNKLNELNELDKLHKLNKLNELIERYELSVFLPDGTKIQISIPKYMLKKYPAPFVVRVFIKEIAKPFLYLSNKKIQRDH